MASKARADLLAIYNAALAAVQGRNLMQRAVKINDRKGTLLVKNPLEDDSENNAAREYDLRGRNIYVVGAGKSVLGLVAGFLEQLEVTPRSFKVTSGILSVPIGTQVRNFDLFKKHGVEICTGAENNIPDEAAVTNTHRIVDLVKRIAAEKTKPALLVTFISGGGSALLCAPKKGVDLRTKREVIESLMKSGCGIEDLNRVRRCLSLVKGGKLAEMATINAPHVDMLNFIASDIVGDPIDLIASGPTVEPKSRLRGAEEAVRILGARRIKCDERLMRIIREEGETKNDDRVGTASGTVIPSSPSSRGSVTNLIVVNNECALRAACAEAADRGYKVVCMGRSLDGEAAKLADRFIGLLSPPRTELVSDKDDGADADYVDDGRERRDACESAARERPPQCWLGGGETVVTVERGCDGIGGRCQELALAFCVGAALNWDKRRAASLLAAGSDGQDGPTPVAGCIVDTDTLQLWSAQHIDEAKMELARHNSYGFWSRHHPEWFLDTGGPTGVNVMDLYCVLEHN